MNDKQFMKGICLCGSVTIQAPMKQDIGACHCSMCRRWGGGPLFAVHCGAGVTISGTEHITVFDSSDWAERAFCSKCGTHLYYRFKPTDEHIVPAGFFQDQGEFNFTEQIFVDGKPAYYDFANKTAMLTEAEVLAKYAPE